MGTVRNWQIFFHTFDTQIWMLPCHMSAYVSTREFNSHRTHRLAQLTPSHANMGLNIKKNMFQNFAAYPAHISHRQQKLHRVRIKNSPSGYFLPLVLQLQTIGNRLSSEKTARQNAQPSVYDFLNKKRHKRGIYYGTRGKGPGETIWLSVAARSHSEVPRTLMRLGCQAKQKQINTSPRLAVVPTISHCACSL